MVRSWKALVAAGLLLTPALYAQQLIMDQEFMSAATTLAAPLRKDLSPQTNVHYILVNDPSINAFVTGENIIYVHSGLVAKAANAGALQGVLAHELGHIASNHLLQRERNAKQAGLGAIAGAVMGIGAAAAGAPQAATALILGGQAGGMQAFMAHTRTQEAEADRRAINALHGAGFSAQGMVDMFTTLRTESQLSYDSPPPWLVTHPLPPERLANLSEATSKESQQLKSGLEKSSASIDFARLQAKVFALTSSPASVLRRYQGSDIVSKYARTMAYVQQGRWDMANGGLEPLLREFPKDAYYRELKAKMALARGDLGTANDVFTGLVADYPDAVLFQYQYAEILRNQNDLKGAAARYERVTRAWPEWADPWMGLGLVYGGMGRIAESHLARTQAFVVAPDYEAAKQSLALARSYLKDSNDANLKDWAAALQGRLDNMK